MERLSEQKAKRQQRKFDSPKVLSEDDSPSVPQFSRGWSLKEPVRKVRPTITHALSTPLEIHETDEESEAAAASEVCAKVFFFVDLSIHDFFFAKIFHILPRFKLQRVITRE